MPVFNFASAYGGRSGKGSAETYNTLIDFLSIKENQLEVDGKLSAGDFDLLITDAQKLMSNPALNAGQRSNIAVKLSQYQKSKSLSGLKDQNDIEILNRELVDDYRKQNMLLASDPASLMQARSFAIQGKLERLTDSISNLEQSGSDPTNHINEFSATLSEYNDLLQASSETQNRQPGQAPSSSFVAYVTTNSKGEINDVEIGRLGAKNGYAETNAVYGGMQVFGKVNRKENGENIFQIGSKRFSAPDMFEYDPNNPGSMKSRRLVEMQPQAQGKQGFNVADPNAYVDLQQNDLRAQGAVGIGGWARGTGGALYKRKENGLYEKYVNAESGSINGLDENDILNVPRTFESSINASVEKTIDATGQEVYLPEFQGPIQAGKEGVRVNGAAPQQAPQPQGEPRTPQPTSRAPQSATGIAGSALDSAKGFLGRLFGRA